MFGLPKENEARQRIHTYKDDYLSNRYAADVNADGNNTERWVTPSKTWSITGQSK